METSMADNDRSAAALARLREKDQAAVDRTKAILLANGMDLPEFAAGQAGRRGSPAGDPRDRPERQRQRNVLIRDIPVPPADARSPAAIRPAPRSAVGEQFPDIR
jgi:hypothetical protein